MNTDFYNKHYIITRDDGSITDTWSDGPRPNKDTSNAICINGQGGYQFRLYPNGEENPSICDTEGIPLYMWNGESVIPRTEEEIAAERTALFNSPEHRAEEIKQMLTELDYKAVRPLRAILAGTTTDEDRNRLREIETQAFALRDELTALEINMRSS